MGSRVDPTIQRLTEDRLLRAALERRRRRSRRGARLMACLIATLLIDAVFGSSGLARRVRAGREQAAVAGRVWQLRAENQKLRANVERLSRDPAAIEASAREHLGLIRPGEIIVVVKGGH